MASIYFVPGHVPTRCPTGQSTTKFGQLSSSILSERMANILVVAMRSMVVNVAQDSERASRARSISIVDLGNVLSRGCRAERVSIHLYMTAASAGKARGHMTMSSI
jgi:hypothetical protein